MNGMFVIQRDGSLVELQEEEYENEDIFQELLEKYPNLIPGDQINEENPRKWLLITREAGIPSDERLSNRWSVDHLFLDQDAIPTLIEVKRSSDTRIRREVVGQMMEYASNSTFYWPLDTIRTKFEEQCDAKLLDPEIVLNEFLGGADSEIFWNKAHENLQSGKIRMLFVADVISNELKRMVEFMNQQMSPAEVLAVEIRQFTGPDLATLVPRVIGMTTLAEKKKRNQLPPRTWSEEEILNIVRASYADVAARLEVITDWASQNHLTMISGTGAKIGAVYYSTDGTSKNVCGFNVSGSIEFMLSAMPLASRMALIGRLAEIKGLELDPTDAKRTYLAVPRGLLLSDATFQIVVDALDNLIMQLRT